MPACAGRSSINTEISLAKSPFFRKYGSAPGEIARSGSLLLVRLRAGTDPIAHHPPAELGGEFEVGALVGVFCLAGGGFHRPSPNLPVSALQGCLLAADCRLAQRSGVGDDLAPVSGPGSTPDRLAGCCRGWVDRRSAPACRFEFFGSL